MTEESDAAARYRQHAQKLRTLARDKTTQEIERQLLVIAEGYEKMAESAEAVDKTNQLLIDEWGSRHRPITER